MVERSLLNRFKSFICNFYLFVIIRFEKRSQFYFQVWERTVQALELEGVQIGVVKGKSKSDESLVKQENETEKAPPKPSVSFQDLFSKES